ncbi:MAG: flagellar basal body-associated FliL family protein [Candidatus Sericytochromatia bacterium]|nr:flagellar basal body-associated FliL family protein [Candidatus Tanganyikabacteria bacterium]
MATKKAPAGGGGTSLISPRMVGGAVAVAIISAVSSFAAIRFALPKQIIVEQRVIHETPKPEHHGVPEGDLWTVGDPFIVNLADPTRRFLKTTVTVKVARDPAAHAEKKDEGGGHGGGHGKAADPGKAIMGRMKPWEPVYRDAIIRTLRRQTTTTLFDQERVKAEIKVALNVLHQQDERIPETLDVFFGDFVIQ